MLILGEEERIRVQVAEFSEIVNHNCVVYNGQWLLVPFLHSFAEYRLVPNG
jgi:hypothetical protein